MHRIHTSVPLYVEARRNFPGLVPQNWWKIQGRNKLILHSRLRFSKSRVRRSSTRERCYCKNGYMLLHDRSDLVHTGPEHSVDSTALCTIIVSESLDTSERPKHSLIGGWSVLNHVTSRASSVGIVGFQTCKTRASTVHINGKRFVDFRTACSFSFLLTNRMQRESEIGGRLVQCGPV